MSPKNTSDETNNPLQSKRVEIHEKHVTTPMFPNYFKELDSLADDRNRVLVEQYLQSVLDRLLIPHMKQVEGEEKLSGSDYFKDLTELARQLAKKEGLNIELYIGGGVVRTLLGNMYKFVHERKSVPDRFTKKQRYELLDKELSKTQSEEKPMTSTTSNRVEIWTLDMSNSEVKRNMKLKQKMLSGTEFHLKQAALAKQKPLHSPFVLGVGSDLDVYYEISPTEGTELTDEQISAGERIAQQLTTHINKVSESYRIKAEAGSYDKLVDIILPFADVKELNKQTDRAVEQGGSMLDSLAFKLELDDDRKAFAKMRNDYHAQVSEVVAESKIRKGTDYPMSPEEYESKIQLIRENLRECILGHQLLRTHRDHEDVLKDFLKGTYEYIAPKNKAKPTQKQAIRGLRPLLEIPFLNVKDPNILMDELDNILKSLNLGLNVDDDAKLQFEKMLRNASYQLAGNRPYREKMGLEETPMTKALEIAHKLPYLCLPMFMQPLPLNAQVNANLRSDVKFMEINSFIEQYTAQGIVYHSTDVKNAICILRSGFIVSSGEKGLTNAVYGPGVYASPDHRVASQYGGEQSLVLPLVIAQDKNLKILDWNSLEPRVKIELEKEAVDDSYKYVFDMLKDRNKYAVDIIIHEHVILQNQNAIELEESLESVFNLSLGRLETAAAGLPFENAEQLKSLYKSYKACISLYEILTIIGLNEDDQLKMRIIKASDTIKDKISPIFVMHEAMDNKDELVLQFAANLMKVEEIPEIVQTFFKDHTDPLVPLGQLEELSKVSEFSRDINAHCERIAEDQMGKMLSNIKEINQRINEQVKISEEEADLLFLSVRNYISLFRYGSQRKYDFINQLDSYKTIYGFLHNRTKHKILFGAIKNTEAIKLYMSSKERMSGFLDCLRPFNVDGLEKDKILDYINIIDTLDSFRPNDINALLQSGNFNNNEVIIIFFNMLEFANPDVESPTHLLACKIIIDYMFVNYPEMARTISIQGSSRLSGFNAFTFYDTFLMDDISKYKERLTPEQKEEMVCLTGGKYGSSVLNVASILGGTKAFLKLLAYLPSNKMLPHILRNVITFEEILKNKYELKDLVCGSNLVPKVDGLAFEVLNRAIEYACNPDNSCVGSPYIFENILSALNDFYRDVPLDDQANPPLKVKLQEMVDDIKGMKIENAEERKQHIEKLFIYFNLSCVKDRIHPNETGGTLSPYALILDCMQEKGVKYHELKQYYDIESYKAIALRRPFNLELAELLDQLEKIQEDSQIVRKPRP